SATAALPNEPSRATASRARKCRNSTPSQLSDPIIELHSNWICPNGSGCRQLRYDNDSRTPPAGRDRPVGGLLRRGLTPPVRPPFPLGPRDSRFRAPLS